jgi:hypothetical protein
MIVSMHLKARQLIVLNQLYEKDEYMKTIEVRNEYAVMEFNICTELPAHACVWLEGKFNENIDRLYDGVAHTDVYTEHQLTFARIHMCSFEYAYRNGEEISNHVLSMYKSMKEIADAVNMKYE